MMRAASLLLVLLALLTPTRAISQTVETNMMTGGPKGTYIQIGRDIAALSRECGRNLVVQESAGSLENLIAVKKRTFTQFGIVQSDVLEYVSTYAGSDPDLARAILGVRSMFPLYNEEVHVLAKWDINSLGELAGRKVAIGVTDSGTYLTATLILDILQVQGVEKVLAGSVDGLDMLKRGEIDAMFYVTGAPASLFSDPEIDGARFHLLPITEKPLLATYNKAQIAGGVYPFQPEPVDVVTVKAVLMTFDYRKDKNDYHQGNCKAVADIANIIVTNLDRLRESGHPKWKNVDLSALPPGWRVGDCVKDGMRADYQLSCQRDTGTLGAAPAPAAEVVDQEYLNLLKQRLGDGG
ncbi:MAG: TAXI family TRAP transporter solute-binding subunit [Tepidamorphaceae bacterium]|nr:TAXI family TRAP transporter solute-binding subunit [Rhodobiaceae bacterium]MCC0047898.1 TAXI family TRAP transporter solute-binding subunit [Rhodobiaceae bacterium]